MLLFMQYLGESKCVHLYQVLSLLCTDRWRWMFQCSHICRHSSTSHSILKVEVTTFLCRLTILMIWYWYKWFFSMTEHTSCFKTSFHYLLRWRPDEVLSRGWKLVLNQLVWSVIEKNHLYQCHDFSSANNGLILNHLRTWSADLFYSHFLLLYQFGHCHQCCQHKPF